MPDSLDQGSSTSNGGNKRGRGGIVFFVILLVGAAGAVTYFLPDQEDHTSEPPAGTSVVVPKSVRERAATAVFQIKATFADGADPNRIHLKYGSCIAVRERGIFVTAAHTVVSERKLVSLTILTDDREYKASIRYSDPSHDIAVVQAKAYAGATLPFVDSLPKEESQCYTFGFPTKYSGTVFPELKAMTGIVEKVDYDHKVADDTPVEVVLVRGTSHFGVSGGAVVDHVGNLIGMSFASRFPSEDSDNPTHVLAIPASCLRAILAESKNSSSGA